VELGLLTADVKREARTYRNRDRTNNKRGKIIKAITAFPFLGSGVAGRFNFFLFFWPLNLPIKAGEWEKSIIT
jgi:hypothetical protein